MAGKCTSYTGFSHPTPSYLILPHPTLDSTPIPSYLAYLILTDRVGWGRVGCLSAMARDTSHFYPTPSNHILLRPTLDSILTIPILPYPTMHPASSYTSVSSHPALSYIILPPLTTSNHILPCCTFLPHPTPYLTAILPHIQPSPTVSYPI